MEKKPYQGTNSLISRKITEGFKHFKYFSNNPEIILEAVKGPIYMAKIPTCCLHSIQEPGEYSNNKEKNIKKAFKSYGQRFLEEFPIITCALPGDSFSDEHIKSVVQSYPYIIAIIDGHHRARYAPSFGIYEIPSRVLSVEQAFMAYQKLTENNPSRQIQNMTTYLDVMRMWVNQATGLFMQENPTLVFRDIVFTEASL